MGPVSEAIRLHHQRWDGAPDDEIISLPGSLPRLDAVRKEAQLLRVLATLESVDQARPGDGRALLDRQVEALDREAGGSLDPHLAAAMVRILRPPAGEPAT
jgi:hypothetical protein